MTFYYRNPHESKEVLLATLFGLAFYLSMIIVMAIWTSRTLGFWLSYIKGAPVESPWWIDAFLSLCWPIAFWGNLISEIARLAV